MYVHHKYNMNSRSVCQKCLPFPPKCLRVYPVIACDVWFVSCSCLMIMIMLHHNHPCFRLVWRDSIRHCCLCGCGCLCGCRCGCGCGFVTPVVPHFWVARTAMKFECTLRWQMGFAVEVQVPPPKFFLHTEARRTGHFIASRSSHLTLVSSACCSACKGWKS